MWFCLHKKKRGKKMIQCPFKSETAKDFFAGGKHAGVHEFALVGNRKSGLK
jgi:hypothetical protein